MSARQSPGLEQLFGYQLQDAPDSHKQHSRQPTGPPLLDESQSGLLHSFFENPDEVNSSFLSLGDEHAFNGDAGPPAGPSYQNHNYNWLFNGPGGPQDLPSQHPHPQHNQFAATPQLHTRPNSQGYSSDANPPGAIAASDDVWAAAQMLQNQNGHHSAHSGQYNGTRPEESPYGHSSTISFPVATHHSSPQYNYNQQAISTGVFPTGFRQQQSLPPSEMQAPMHFSHSHHGPPTRPALQLKFGSDEHFRSESFRTPSKFEPPDQIFRETINHNFRYAENNPLGMNPLSSGSTSHETSPVQKRARPIHRGNRSPREKAGNSSADEEAVAEETPAAKRRKSQVIKKEAVESPAPRPAPKSTSAKAKDKKGKAREAQTSASPVPAALEYRDDVGPPAGARSRSSQSASRNLAASNSGADDDMKPSRENLTEEQKRANHILSEQKRRNLIKQGFEDLNRMVPELRSGGFSKSNMLVEAAKFMRTLQQGNAALKSRLKGLDNG